MPKFKIKLEYSEKKQFETIVEPENSEEAKKTIEELKKNREEYVKKYIGDFNKPIDYERTLSRFDRLIISKH